VGFRTGWGKKKNVLTQKQNARPAITALPATGRCCMEVSLGTLVIRRAQMVRRSRAENMSTTVVDVGSGTDHRGRFFRRFIGFLRPFFFSFFFESARQAAYLVRGFPDGILDRAGEGMWCFSFFNPHAPTMDR
jgi:hypothetical protein